jgi:translation initiation factor 1
MLIRNFARGIHVPMSKQGFNNPFADALKDHPALEKKEETEAPVSASGTKKVPAPARAVVRMERKGRGGKEVTVVEQLELPAKDLERWLKSLKGALGCGGTVEDGSLVLQGDHRKRLKELLEARGVKKVSVG